ncbi:nucleolar complex protein 2 homolog isoform X2 [Arachis ipaensis]|uniref:nucleolar complex protein 2 homolog isoform X2 n=1 Tax=Arachis ipaensis TaxID=130454 RepID=UPI0007AFA1EA|nr:nucleolar complex protein 2 homolog isoform X2 [Arachis ipaensis]
MGKLGKKARKFARKNLQSVLRNKRKLKSKFKRKASKTTGGQDVEENQERDTTNLSTERKAMTEEIEDVSLDDVFSEDDSEGLGEDSDSDVYLSEDSCCAHLTECDGESENNIDSSNGGSSLMVHNRDIRAELVKKAKRLNKLKEKDPEFARFLERYDVSIKQAKDDETSSDDEGGLDGMHPMNEDAVRSHVPKCLTSGQVDSLCNMVKKDHNMAALTCLINAYCTACHSDSKAPSASISVLSHNIQSGETFSKILMFMLHEADTIFRKLLGLSCSNCKKETVLELKNTSKWLSLKPLIKSYLRSTLFLLNQVTDSELLTFTICRLRTSIIFLVAFPTLLRKLLKISVHLWATGDESLSSHSFLIIKDISSMFGLNWFDSCFVKTYKAFINHAQYVDQRLFEHIHFLRNSFLELCSLDVQKSSNMAMKCMLHLAKILQKGRQTKKKEVVKKICSWQYINCIELWVAFISANAPEYDLHPLLYMIVQIINGIALLFPGPRYLPLRIRCIQWLNQLAGSTGIFIPVISLVLDVVAYKIAKDGGRKPGKGFELQSTIKLPKHWLKSRNFQVECISSAIELLSEHFAQWSYHISFPELATAPLVHLKKLYEITSIESSRRVIKRFIDQVEMNVDFVQKKREEAPFSPKDQQTVETFLQVSPSLLFSHFRVSVIIVTVILKLLLWQIERRSGNTPFTQYYRSIMSKAVTRKMISNTKAALV